MRGQAAAVWLGAPSAACAHARAWAGRGERAHRAGSGRCSERLLCSARAAREEWRGSEGRGPDGAGRRRSGAEEGERRREEGGEKKKERKEKMEKGKKEKGKREIER